MTHLLLFIGTTELLLIGGIALLLFGGKKLPEMMRGLGQGVREFKKGVNDIEAQAGEKPGRSRMLIHMPVPLGESQLLPRRPFPALWQSATTRVPWGAPFSASFLAWILVESVSSK